VLLSPARSLAWASDRAGLAESSPHGLSWAQPQKNRKIKIKKVEKNKKIKKI